MQPEMPVPQRVKTKSHLAISKQIATSSASLTAIDDSALVHATKGGDIAAFEELAKRYRQKLLRVAQSLTHNHEDAQEVVQEALLKAFQKLGQFQGQAKFSTWLFRINVNESRMKMRKRMSTDVPIVAGTGGQDIPPFRETIDPRPNPEDFCYASELRHILLSASMKLKPRLRRVFVLRDVEGLSIDQTATRLHLNESTVKSRLRRARIQLRDQLRRRLAFGDRFIDIDVRTIANKHLGNWQYRRRRKEQTSSQ